MTKLNRAAYAVKFTDTTKANGTHHVNAKVFGTTVGEWIETDDGEMLGILMGAGREMTEGQTMAEWSHEVRTCVSDNCPMIDHLEDLSEVGPVERFQIQINGSWVVYKETDARTELLRSGPYWVEYQCIDGEAEAEPQGDIRYVTLMLEKSGWGFEVKAIAFGSSSKVREDYAAATA